MIARPRRRGAPLVFVVIVIGGWAGLRVLTWEDASAVEGLGGPVLSTEADAAALALFHRRAPVSANPHRPVQLRLVAASAPPEAIDEATVRHGDALRPAATVSTFAFSTRDDPSILLLASTTPPPLPAPFEPTALSIRAVEKRWSADGWALLRADGKSGGGLLPRYGASQIGTVLRYRLSPGRHGPAAYVRAAAALDGSGQKEAAAGLSARPFPDLPLVAAAELRVTSDRFGTRMRPAMLAYTEVPPIELPAGLLGEVYVQGGYVGGKEATAFVDGQVRADARLAGIGRGQLRLGAGAWGGAQKGASRLDVGPQAQIVLPLSDDVFARLALDWRFRVAGDAAPGSGPALTLSAGF